MIASGLMHIERLKGNSIILVAARHNLRAAPENERSGSSIDHSLSHKNQVLRGSTAPEDVSDLAKRLMQGASVGKLRKDAVRGIEVLFSLPRGSELDTSQYFSDCVDWAEAEFGGPQNMLSAVIHNDEAAMHCHVIMLPLVDGRMNGGKLYGSNRRRAELQTRFYSAVASKHGLRKPESKLRGSAKGEAFESVMSALRESDDPCLRSAIWPKLRQCLERDPLGFMLGLGLEPPDAPAKPLKSMTAIFTSPGAGPKREKPIDFETGATKRSPPLCGLPSERTTSDRTDRGASGASTAAHQDAASAARTPPEALPLPEALPTPPTDPIPLQTQSEYTRTRDSDLDPLTWDAETGEYITPPRPRLQLVKTAAREAIHAMRQAAAGRRPGEAA